MGRVIRLEHHVNCMFEYKFFSGTGMLSSLENHNAREKMRSGEWGDHWKELLEQYPEGTATINNELFYCEHCKQFHTMPEKVFHIPDEGFHFDYFKPEEEVTLPEFLAQKKGEVIKVKRRPKEYVDPEILFDHYHILERESFTCTDCNSVLTHIDDLENLPCPRCGEPLNVEFVGLWD